MLWRSRHQSAACPNLPLPQINGSLARAAIKELLGKGLIKEVAKSRAQQVRSHAEAIALRLCCLARLKGSKAIVAPPGGSTCTGLVH